MTNPDGTVDLYFGFGTSVGKAVQLDADQNGRSLRGAVRLYGPQKPIFEKSWKLPDIASTK
jgi:hypothetical protein